MPCPHYRIKISSRAQGKNTVAQAAYQSGERLFDERSHRTKDYREKRGMDVLGFLDWMDRKEYFYKIQQVSFEEMLLEPNHDKQINGLIRKYRDFRKNNYTISDRDFEHRVDILLSYLKREMPS